MSLNPQSMRSMAEELKLAEVRPQAPPSAPAPAAPGVAGKVESKLPWYTTAAGSLTGAAAGGAVANKLLPKKLQLAGKVGGALLGTAVGLEGGEALGRRIDRRKTAAAHEEKGSPAKLLGKSLLGLGAGIGAGYLGARALGGGMHPSTAAKMAPFVGGALGLATPLMYHGIVERMREEHLKKQEAARVSQNP